MGGQIWAVVIGDGGGRIPGVAGRVPVNAGATVESMVDAVTRGMSGVEARAGQA